MPPAILPSASCKLTTQITPLQSIFYKITKWTQSTPQQESSSSIKKLSISTLESTSKQTDTVLSFSRTASSGKSTLFYPTKTSYSTPISLRTMKRHWKALKSTLNSWNFISMPASWQIHQWETPFATF